MYFRQVFHEDRSCLSYLVGCQSKGICAVVDPQGDVEPYLAAAGRAGMRITDVVETHIQADHPSAARTLAAAAGAALHLGAEAAVAFPFSPLRDGDLLRVGNRRLTALHTPGHTPEHVTLYVDEWFLLTGDTLFVGDVGRVDLALEPLDEAGLRRRAGQLYDSLQRLLALPDHVEVYPGHYAGSSCGRGLDGKAISTIGRERRVNPALRMDREAFARYQTHDVPPPPADYQRIKRHNMDAG